jgi:hypothetical protein
MHRFRFLILGGLVFFASVGFLLAADEYRRTDVFQFVNGIVFGEAKLSGMNTPSTGVVQVGGSDVTSVRTTATAGTWLTMPATQTIGAGGTIAADACGGVKRITAAGAVTTDTTNSLTAPTTVPGCTMTVCNVGTTNTITIDQNALMLLQGGANVALLANSCLGVISDGVVWRQSSAQQTST